MSKRVKTQESRSTWERESSSEKIAKQRYSVKATSGCEDLDNSLANTTGALRGMKTNLYTSS